MTTWDKLCAWHLSKINYVPASEGIGELVLHNAHRLCFNVVYFRIVNETNNILCLELLRKCVLKNSPELNIKSSGFLQVHHYSMYDSIVLKMLFVDPCANVEFTQMQWIYHPSANNSPNIRSHKCFDITWGESLVSVSLQSTLMPKVSWCHAVIIMTRMRNIIVTLLKNRILQNKYQ